MILQRHVGGADHQPLLLGAAGRDARDQIREGFAHAGWRFNRQMARIVARQALRHFGDHLALRRTWDEVRHLLLKRFIPLRYLAFYCGCQGHDLRYHTENMACIFTQYPVGVSFRAEFFVRRRKFQQLPGSGSCGQPVNPGRSVTKKGQPHQVAAGYASTLYI